MGSPEAWALPSVQLVEEMESEVVDQSLFFTSADETVAGK